MSFNAFAAFVYVTETEHEAVMRMYDWKEKYFDNDRQLYMESSFKKDGKDYLVVCARQNEMGMTASATLSMKLIDHYRPMYLVMPGIAAGTGEETADDQIFGDVVLADSIWNCSNGKFVPPELADIKFGSVGFKPRPTYIDISPELISYFNEAISSDKNETHVHLGAIASGSAVVATREFIDKQIHSQSKNTKGLEMEGYGVFYAAENATEPRPLPIVAKSICDFADSRKSDVYQKFAAMTSCEFVKFLVENYLPIR